MGQQQLLLLVLATVIVGLATVAGIQAFDQGQKRANQDALTSTAVKIASDIQAKAKEPSQFGGLDGNLGSISLSGGNSSSKNMSLEKLGYKTNSSGEYVTSSGTCTLTDGSSASSGSPNVGVECDSDQATVNVVVKNLDPKGIVTTTKTIKS